MVEIDETIGRVEKLYRALTGKAFEDGTAPYAPIPEGVDPDQHVQRELDRLLAALDAARPSRAWAPPMSVVEGGAEIVVQLDVPGVTRDGIVVSQGGGLLVVEGRRALAPEVFGDRPHGRFRRSMVLPPGLDLEKMSARLVDGVLEIRIPRLTNGEPRPIPIA